VVRPGRTFVSRMYATAARVKELDFYTRLNKEFHSDFAGGIPSWLVGMALACYEVHPSHHQLIFLSSGSWGCGAFFKGYGFSGNWPGYFYNGQRTCTNSF